MEPHKSSDQQPQPTVDSTQGGIVTDAVPGAHGTMPSAQPRRSSRKKLAIIIVGIVLLLLAASMTWLLYANKDKPEAQSVPNTNVLAESPASSDKEGIQAAVDTYCQDLAEAYGFVGMDSGYIISDRFSEEELSDSPYILRFRQVGEAASATIDCEDDEGPNGLSTDLLFAKVDGTWKYVDVAQNNAFSGFLCSVVDEYNVSKDLVKECAQNRGGPVTAR